MTIGDDGIATLEQNRHKDCVKWTLYDKNRIVAMVWECHCGDCQGGYAVEVYEPGFHQGLETDFGSGIKLAMRLYKGALKLYGLYG